MAKLGDTDVIDGEVIEDELLAQVLAGTKRTMSQARRSAVTGGEQAYDLLARRAATELYLAVVMHPELDAPIDSTTIALIQAHVLGLTPLFRKVCFEHWGVEPVVVGWIPELT